MNFNQDWEQFTEGPGESPKNRIHVTLNRFGMLLMNTAAYQSIGSPEAVTFFYNRHLHRIGVRSIPRRDRKAFPVMRFGSSWRVQACNFCRAHGIHPEKTEKFIEPTIDPDGDLILDLNNTLTVERAAIRKVRTAARVLVRPLLPCWRVSWSGSRQRIGSCRRSVRRTSAAIAAGSFGLPLLECRRPDSWSADKLRAAE
jgi:hypothetical protein